MFSLLTVRCPLRMTYYTIVTERALTPEEADQLALHTYRFNVRVPLSRGHLLGTVMLNHRN